MKKHRFAPKFVLTYHNCGELGHIKPMCRKSLIRNNKQDLDTHIRFLTNQLSHLTELITQLSRITSSSKKVCAKKSELIDQSDDFSYGIARVALYGENFSLFH